MSARTTKVVFTGPGSLELQEHELPALQPREIRIRTLTTLISPGTERAFYLGLPNTTQKYPQYSGYNNIGEVIAIGDTVTELNAGDIVASPTHHASLVQSDVAEVYPIPAGLDLEKASFFNLVSIALQGVRKARIEIGEHAAIIGAGLIGLLAGELAKLNGALSVTVHDLDASRLEYASKLGLDARLVNGEAPPVQDPPPSVVIEATGRPAAVNAALQLAADHGRVILLGSTRGVTGEVNFYRDVHRKGLHIIGAHDIARPSMESHPGYWTQSADRVVALQLLAAGRIQVASLITHRMSWRDANVAYDMLRQWDASALGVILNWRD